MTIEQTVTVLNCVEAHGSLTERAKQTAIKSLECWREMENLFDTVSTLGEKIKVKEVQEVIDSYIELIENQQNGGE